MSLTDKRVNVLPNEYPELLELKDAIRHSYWLHTEFNYSSDIQDWKTKLKPEERNTIERAMLAIAQIEVDVKRFWANLYNIFPKPEFDAVGVTFAESEVRHQDAYSFLLELLGLQERFNHLDPILLKRIEQANRIKNSAPFLSVILFAQFIEHISLFSQFIVVMSFNKEKNILKGISNAIEATSKEEEIHGQAGILIHNLLVKENLLDEAFYTELRKLAEETIQTELELVDWLFSDGDLGHIKKETVKDYVHYRYQRSLRLLGLKPEGKEWINPFPWFDEELLGIKEGDFFNKRITDYSKRTSAITKDNLFD